MGTPTAVRDIMATAVTTLEDSAFLIDAALILRRTGFRHLPIVNGERLVGLITDRDVYRYAPSLLTNISAEEYNRVFESTPISRVMTREIVTVTPETSIEEAVALLHSKKLGCLPVVEKDKLVGMVTVTDMLEVLHRILSPSGEESLAQPGTV